MTILACLFLQASAYASPEVIRDKTSGKLLYVMPDQAERAEVQADRVLESDVALETHKAILGLSSPTVDLIPGQPEVDDLGYTHITYKQNYKGVPVYRATLISHLDPAGRVQAINARVSENLNLKTKPLVSAKAASRIAASLWSSELSATKPEIKAPELVIFDEALLKNTSEGKAYLAWKIQALHHATRTDRTYLVNARTGALLQQESSERNQALNQRIYDCSIINQSGNWGCPSQELHTEFDPDYTFGRRLAAPARGPNPIAQFNFSREVDISYEYLAPAAYDYYLQTFGRFGANGVGGMGDGTYMPIGRTAIFTLVDNVWPMSAGGCPNNARWVGAWGEVHLCKGVAEYNPSQEQMGTVLHDYFTHEYAHALMFSEFGNTNYSGQPGTNEEALADIMGEFNEYHAIGATTPAQRTWIAGEHVGEWARSLADPPSISDPVYGPYPDKLHSAHFYCGSDDNGGVHLNATVFGKAAYLMTEGGQFNGCYIKPISVAKAQNIFYDFITSYMTPTTSFNQADLGLKLTCKNRYGEGSFECQQVEKALQAVEYNQAARCSGTKEVRPACARAGFNFQVSDTTGKVKKNFTLSDGIVLLGQGIPDAESMVYLASGSTPIKENMTLKSLTAVATARAKPANGDDIYSTIRTYIAPAQFIKNGSWQLVIDTDKDKIFSELQDSVVSFSIGNNLIGDASGTSNTAGTVIKSGTTVSVIK